MSTNLVLCNDSGAVVERLYLRTNGQPIRALAEGMQALRGAAGTVAIDAVGVTGSGRRLAGVVLGADVVKNEITAHAVAALHEVPGVQTIIEIGGQDSKLILLRHGVVSDFAMNTVCAAGTGSFLDQQAARLSVPIEEFGRMAEASTAPVRIAGRCAVLAESDMIHKQQAGHRLADIVAGLCSALVRNYLGGLAKGKDLLPIVVFQGGVAANPGMRKAFERALDQSIVVPEYHDVMGALGAALLAREWRLRTPSTTPSSSRGLPGAVGTFDTGSSECTGCPNACEVVRVTSGGGTVAIWGDRCGKWQGLIPLEGKECSVAAGNPLC